MTWRAPECRRSSSSTGSVERERRRFSGVSLVEGDFDRAITLIQEAIAKNGGKPLSDRIIKGLVATLHKMATGARPGQAPMERGH